GRLAHLDGEGLLKSIETVPIPGWITGSALPATLSAGPTAQWISLKLAVLARTSARWTVYWSPRAVEQVRARERAREQQEAEIHRKYVIRGGAVLGARTLAFLGTTWLATSVHDERLPRVGGEVLGGAVGGLGAALLFQAANGY